MKFLDKKIGYYHGRFQPFHLGHIEVVKTALRYCDLLVIGISNPFRALPVIESHFNEEEIKSLRIARDPINNPWPYWARMLMVKEGLAWEGIDLKKILFIPNVSNTGLPIEEFLFPKSIITVFICPKDKHNIAAYRKYCEDGWDVFKITVKHNMLGSGIIRERIRKNLNWEPLVPKGTAEVIKYLYKNFQIP